MKNASTGRYRLHVLVLGAFLSSSILHAEEKQTSMKYKVDQWRIAQSFSWLQNGELLCLRLGPSDFPSADLIYYNSLHDGKSVLLNGSIDALASLIAGEGVAITKGFLSDDIPRLFKLTQMQRGDAILNDEYVASHKVEHGEKADGSSKLIEYMDLANVELSSSSWTISFVTIKLNGEIQHWTLGGIVSPFSIGSVHMDRLANKGDIFPLSFH